LITCSISNADSERYKHHCSDVIKVAVIDTGFGYDSLGHGAKLCKFGHKDFSGNNRVDFSYNTVTPIPLDSHGHGTNIIGIIDNQAKESGANYCIIVLKYYD